MLVHMGVCGIGLGHASRSSAVAKELIRRGHKVSITAYGEAIKYLEREGLKPMPNLRLNYGLSEDGSVSIKQTIIKNILLPVKFGVQVARETSIIDALKPSVVYSDTRASTVAAAKSLGLPVLTVLNQYNIPLEVRKHKRLAAYVEGMIQLPSLVWDRSDIIAIPDLPPPYTISSLTLNLKDQCDTRVEYVGPMVQRRVVEDREVRRLRKNLGADGRMLVFVHISGNRPERLRLAGKIVPILESMKGFRFIFSLGNPDGRQRVDKDNITIFDWVEDVETLMAASDLIIARAGLTVISKAIIYGKRIIVIPTPLHGEQLRNARRVEELGFGRAVDEDRLDLQQALYELSYDGESERRALEISGLASEMDGISAVAGLLEELAMNIKVFRNP